MYDYIPEVVQVIPFEDYTVHIYFDDGKITCFDAKKDLHQNLLKVVAPIFIERCTVMNGTLAWDVSGVRNYYECIDIDPIVLHELPAIKEVAPE